MTNQANNIVSTLLESDPEMMGIVEKFLVKLPDYLDQCKLALASENWEALRELLHVLKGMGGSYGYPAITDVAKQAESELKAGDSSNTKAFLERLIQISEAAQRGYQQQAG